MDIEKIVKENGSIDFKVKPGAVPSVKPKQNKRLLDFDRTQENSEEENKLVIVFCESFSV